ncbi:MAG: carboxypeptidase-like regulatory domain-containing protein [Promethearchaeota archaeon]
MKNLKKKTFFIFILALWLVLILYTSINANSIAPGYTITCNGYVRDLNTNNPISNVKVTLKEIELGFSKTTYTNSKGLYSVTLSTPSYYKFKLTVSKSGWVSKSATYYRPGTYTKNFHLYPTSAQLITCYGYVQDNFGNKIPEATIRLSEITASVSKTTKSNSNGYYSIQYYATSLVLFRQEVMKNNFGNQLFYYSSGGTHRKDITLIEAPGIYNDIRNVGSASQTDYIKQGTNPKIVAECSYNSLLKYYYSIDGGSLKQLTRWGSTDRFYFTLQTSSLSLGTHVITVHIYDYTGLIPVFCSDRIFTLTNLYRMRLYYEIDYMNGFEPPQEVLDYWTSYWDSRAIKLIYKIDDKIPYKYGVNRSEFWNYENSYNNHEFSSYGTVDDRAYGNKDNSVYTSQEKWIFWGSISSYFFGSGACDSLRNGDDIVAGNYIFICAEKIQDSEEQNNINNYGNFITTTMHEAGHSIGIAVLDGNFQEVYDPDTYSIMSKITVDRALFTNLWYYSVEYWATRNDIY